MATVSFLLDKRSTNKEGRHPLKLNVYINGAGQRPFSTGYFFDEKTWKDLPGSRKKEDKALWQGVKDKLAKAESILKELNGKNFSWKTFRAMYHSEFEIINSDSGISVKNLFMDAMKKMEANFQFKTASNYSCAMNSLLQHGGDGLMLHEITVDWLNGYRTWAYSKDLSPTTVSDYIRPLRALYNRAIRQKLIPLQNSPFVGDESFKVGEAESADAALTPEQMRIWQQYVPKNEAQHKIKSFWFFSYYCNGIGFTDICHLKKRSINGEFIEFYRHKTIKTSKKPKLVRALINQVMTDVLENYGADAGPYVFPFLKENMSEKVKVGAIGEHQRLFSRVLFRLGKKLGFRIPFGAARHTHATAKHEMGAQMRDISDSLGHSRTSTTENYLARIKPSTMKKNASMLDDYFNAVEDATAV